MKKEDILFILDRAHGEDVDGKSSPDGSFLEWEYSEKVVKKLSNEMDKLEIPNVRTAKEDEKNEIGLIERIKRGNEYAKETNIPIFISFHNNGGGGTGNEIYVKKEPSKEEKKIANIIGNRFINDFKDISWRRCKQDQTYKEANFIVLYGSDKYEIYPQYNGILFEFLFMDNEQDLKLLKDEENFKKYIDTMLYSFVEICESFNLGNFNLPK